MASLTVFNKAGERVAENVTADTFAAARKVWGRGSAVVVQSDCHEVFVDSVKLLRRLPVRAYEGRLLKRATCQKPEFEGYTAWQEA